MQTDNKTTNRQQSRKTGKTTQKGLRKNIEAKVIRVEQGIKFRGLTFEIFIHLSC